MKVSEIKWGDVENGVSNKATLTDTNGREYGVYDRSSWGLPIIEYAIYPDDGCDSKVLKLNTLEFACWLIDKIQKLPAGQQNGAGS